MTEHEQVVYNISVHITNNGTVHQQLLLATIQSI